MKTNLAEKRGRFIVQEIDKKEFSCKKSRHYSINRPMTHLFYSSDEKEFLPHKFKFMPYVKKEDDKWENVNDLWKKVKVNFVNEKKGMEVLFSYDLVNKNENIDISIEEEDNNLVFIPSSGKNENKLNNMNLDEEYEGLVSGGNFFVNNIDSDTNKASASSKTSDKHHNSDHVQYKSSFKHVNGKFNSDNENKITNFYFSLPSLPTHVT